MSDITQKAINSCINGELAFCKFISANETGTTGSHQVGFYIPQNSYNILFDSRGIKGENKEKSISIKWQDDFETDSRFKYYGRSTRNEYRITRFGRNFPYLNENNIGDLFVIAKKEEESYEAFVLDNEEDIETFLSYFGLSPSDTNRIIKISRHLQLTLTPEDILDRLLGDYVNNLTDDFPSTNEISREAREIYKTTKDKKKYPDNDVFTNPDKELLNWLSIEFDLFKAIENNRYSSYINEPLYSVERLVEIANTVLNRRKSRAGKSLENHLVEMFTLHELPFTHQPVTEGKKKPDFIFPGESYYFQDRYKEKLVFLAAKTTCKDRWRQILNEADRIEQKHLFTLQPGISKNQLDEMYESDVILVVPKDYHSYYPTPYRDEILTLNDFISYTKNKCIVE
jgi:EcoRII C terminal./Restriction endonuclease EcoRII, N-terminal.